MILSLPFGYLNNFREIEKCDRQIECRKRHKISLCARKLELALAYTYLSIYIHRFSNGCVGYSEQASDSLYNSLSSIAIY